MASKALNSPLLRHVAKRGYAQAAPAVSSVASVQSSVGANKTLLAAVDNGSPLARVTVAFKAGSRYEPASEPGISHVVRSSAGLTTKHMSGFIMKRKLEQYGANISVSGDREFIYYTLEATQDKLDTTMEILASMISNQEFRPWELSDNADKIKYEIAAIPPQVRAVDLLHKAAFRRALGNSLYISPRRIGGISSESLQHFTQGNLTSSRCAVAVVGGNCDKANLIINNLQIASGDGGQGEAAKYYGGELRKEMGGELAHVALAGAGAPANSAHAIALAVAAKALGNGPVTKWGSDPTPLAKAIGNIGPFAAAGFNVSYTDNGLVGVVLSVPKDEATAAVKNAANLLKSPCLSDSDVNAGKNQLKLQILSEAEDGISLAESLAAQLFYMGTCKSPVELAQMVEKVTANDVNSALSKAAQKLSMGAAGSLSNVPYVDEL